MYCVCVSCRLTSLQAESGTVRGRTSGPAGVHQAGAPRHRDTVPACIPVRSHSFSLPAHQYKVCTCTMCVLGPGTAPGFQLDSKYRSTCVHDDRGAAREQLTRGVHMSLRSSGRGWHARRACALGVIRGCTWQSGSAKL